MSTPDDSSKRARLEYSAASGDPKAMHDLGYEFETATPPDHAEARKWYELAVAAGYTDAYFRLGYLLNESLAQQDQLTAIGWYRKAAAHGDRIAMFNIGVLSEYRIDPPDYQAARHWYEQAANAGHTNAYYRLAYVLEERVMPRDLAGARHWYEKAAETGDARATFNVGYLYETADPPDYPSALRWYEKAAAADYEYADYAVGLMLDKRITPRDAAGARRWYEKAAAHGDSRADYALAEIAEKDNDPMTLVLYERAAANGSAHAMNWLGHHLWMRPSGRNAPAATAWFERSAANGFAMAASNLVKIGVAEAPPEGQSPLARGIRPELVPSPVPAAVLGFTASAAPTGIRTELDAAVEDSPYRHNAFRLSGLPADANGRLLRKRVTELDATERLGVPVAAATLLPVPSPPDSGEVKAALNQLREPNHRLVQELFWIWPDNSGSPVSGDIDLLERTWLARLPQDATAAHNLAVLRHIQALESPRGAHAETWLDALTAWDAVICAAEPWVWLRARADAIGDNRSGTAALAELRDALPAALVHMHANLIVRAAVTGDRKVAELHIDVLTKFAEQITGRPSSFDAATVDSVRDAAVRKLAAHTRTLSDDASRAIKAAPKDAGAAAQRLLDGAKIPLLVIDRLRPVTDPIGSGAHDDLVRMAILCDVAQFNETRSVPTSVSILERLGPLATTPSIRDRLAVEWAATAGGQIADLCVAAREKSDNDPKQGLQIARDLLEDTRLPLARMRSAPKPDAENIGRASDRIATAAINCVVGYFNETSELEATAAELDKIRPLALGKEALEYLHNQDTVLAGIKAKREEAKRLADTCWFCEQRMKVDAAQYRIGLHNNVTRQGNVRRWNSLHVDVPRCEECKSEHAPGAVIRGMAAFFGTVAGIAAFIGFLVGFFNPHHPGAAFAVGVIGALIVIVSVAASAANNEAPERAHKYPRVEQLLAEGWRKGDRPT